MYPFCRIRATECILSAFDVLFSIFLIIVNKLTFLVFNSKFFREGPSFSLKLSVHGVSVALAATYKNNWMIVF